MVVLPALVALFALAPEAGAATPTTDLVSLSSTAVKSNGDSDVPAVNADGRWVAFTSFATNLETPDTNGLGDIFLRDRLRGETRRVTTAPGGAQSNGSPTPPSISDDGRFVAFGSNATNLDPASPGGFQAFVFDRNDRSIRRLSTNVGPSPLAYQSAGSVEISGDGRRVVYTAKDSTGTRTDVFLADVASGVVRRLGEPSPGVRSNGNTQDPAISGDGRWAAYSTFATDLVTDMNNKQDVVIEDLDTGEKQRASVTSAEDEANNNSDSPALDSDGCRVAFSSSAINLTTNATLAGTKTFVRDRCQGDTEAVSISNGGTVGTSIGSPAISGDGCAVAFRTTSSILVPPPTTRAALLRDRCTGSTSRLDVSTTGDAANGAASERSVDLSGATGRYAVFASAATNLSGLDGDAVLDVFIRDRANNTPPTAAFTVTQSANHVVVDATASRDPDGPSLTGSIGFGDGSAETPGLQAVKDYARAGTYTISLVVSDPDGATARTTQSVTVPDPPPPPPGTGTTPPGTGTTPLPTLGIGTGAGTPPPRVLGLTGARLSRSSFAVGPRTGKLKGIQGATLSATLTEAATLTLTFERQASGRRAGKTCSTKAKKGSRCTVYLKDGTLKRAFKAGAVTLALNGRLGATALRLGAHRVRISARTADGRTAKPVTLTFKIVKEKRK